jgi:CDP-2,3-bis-(O-geranylgeranyl)-sn-glycerol synthase
MWRGLMVMPVAAAGAFAGLAYFRDELPGWLGRGMWPLPPTSFAMLGLASGLAFMLAELPNSFLKRQLDVAPGQAPTRRAVAALCFVLDRIDSTIGVLLVLSLLVPVPPQTWLWALLIGAAAHGLFSMLLHALHIKARPL